MLPSNLWPLAGLTVRTPRLTLSVPDEGQLMALARLAEEGLHPPDTMPFLVPWTDVAPRERARSVMRYQWDGWATLRPEAWRLGLVVEVDGVVVGLQDVNAQDFSVLREVTTGSWLGQEHQGRDIGTEMRAAVLALAFRGLGARAARSSAFVDNAPSIGVSTKLGYATDGTYGSVSRGKVVETQRFVITQEAWFRSSASRLDVVIDGLEPCLAELGAEPA